MSRRLGSILVAMSALGLFLIIPQLSSAASKSFTVRVTPLEGQTLLIKDFKEGRFAFWRAKLGSSYVQLDFPRLAQVRFLNPGKDLMAEVTFKDGAVDVFELLPDGSMYGKSRFGNWSLSHGAVKLIEFVYPGGNAAAGDVAPSVGNVDQVILKNGDQLGGSIQNPSFTLRTSYGVLSFDRSKISLIEFEGGGQNIDVVTLRTGDKISGVIQDSSVKLLLQAGGEAELAKDKIKRLRFKQ